MTCAWCDRPLECDTCGAAFEPRTPEEYEAIAAGEQGVACPACEAVLVCRWCKTPYARDERDVPDLR